MSIKNKWVRLWNKEERFEALEDYPELILEFEEPTKEEILIALKSYVTVHIHNRTLITVYGLIMYDEGEMSLDQWKSENGKNLWKATPLEKYLYPVFIEELENSLEV